MGSYSLCCPSEQRKKICCEHMPRTSKDQQQVGEPVAISNCVWLISKLALILGPVLKNLIINVSIDLLHKR